MGKVRRLTSALRRREFLVASAGTFAIVLGLASTVLTISGRHFELAGSLAVGVAAAVLSVVVNRRHLAFTQVVVDDVLSAELFEDPSVRLRCPCDLAVAAEAKTLADRCFSGDVTIEPDVFEQFRVKNPFILACLTSRSGAFLGYFDAIPLKAEFAESFLRGTLTEAQITHEDVLGVQEMGTCRYVFISGFAASDPDTHRGKRSASILTWALLHYLDAHYAAAKPLVFALAATRSGNELLQRFRLQSTGDGSDRRDRYRLYTLPLDAQGIERRLACLPDWKGICRLDWAPHLAVAADPHPVPPQERPWDLVVGTGVG